MTMESIPDFTETELWTIKEALKERYRYGNQVEIQLADSELRLNPDEPVITLCPTVFWQVDDVSFVIFKTTSNQYRCQFFYSAKEQFGTGIEKFDNIAECVTTLLQVQADHAGKKNLESD